MGEDYDLIDAALDSVKNYLRATESEPEDAEITLSPRFNEDGDTVEMRYELDLPPMDTGHDVEVQHKIGTTQDFEGIDAFEELEYSDWVRRFTTEMPQTELHYLPTPVSDPTIDHAVEKVDMFIDAFYVELKDFSVLLDPVYDENTKEWYVEYFMRANFIEKSDPATMEVSHRFEGTDEEFRRTIYPQLISRLRSEFSNGDIYYPDPEELD